MWDEVFMASCSPALALERMEEIRQRSSGNEHNPASGGSIAQEARGPDEFVDKQSTLMQARS